MSQSKKVSYYVLHKPSESICKVHYEIHGAIIHLVGVEYINGKVFNLMSFYETLKDAERKFCKISTTKQGESL